MYLTGVVRALSFFVRWQAGRGVTGPVAYASGATFFNVSIMHLRLSVWEKSMSDVRFLFLDLFLCCFWMSFTSSL